METPFHLVRKWLTALVESVAERGKILTSVRKPPMIEPERQLYLGVLRCLQNEAFCDVLATAFASLVENKNEDDILFLLKYLNPTGCRLAFAVWLGCPPLVRYILRGAKTLQRPVRLRAYAAGQDHFYDYEYDRSHEDAFYQAMGYVESPDFDLHHSKTLLRASRDPNRCLYLFDAFELGSEDVTYMPWRALHYPNARKRLYDMKREAAKEHVRHERDSDDSNSDEDPWARAGGSSDDDGEHMRVINNNLPGQQTDEDEESDSDGDSDRESDSDGNDYNSYREMSFSEENYILMLNRPKPFTKKNTNNAKKKANGVANNGNKNNTNANSSNNNKIGSALANNNKPKNNSPKTPPTAQKSNNNTNSPTTHTETLNSQLMQPNTNECNLDDLLVNALRSPPRMARHVTLAERLLIVELLYEAGWIEAFRFDDADFAKAVYLHFLAKEMKTRKENESSTLIVEKKESEKSAEPIPIDELVFDFQFLREEACRENRRFYDKAKSNRTKSDKESLLKISNRSLCGQQFASWYCWMKIRLFLLFLREHDITIDIMFSIIKPYFYLDFYFHKYTRGTGRQRFDDFIYLSNVFNY